MNTYDDTICAIATALSPAGIGIIRISGKEALKIASSIFVNKNKKSININESHKVYYGYIFNKNANQFLDEVLLIPMLKPKSYTADDVVEIQCHGGILVLKNILNLIIELGARPAEPGEFTKRAFLNGRIDLSKSEAISDIISSKNDYALKASFNQLKGNLSQKIENLRKSILESIAYIEACLDDPEHLSLDNYKKTLKILLENSIMDLSHIINNYDNGKIIKEGINTVILGKPNVGKSSLLNTLLNENRAIVTDIAGTTRDTIKETINIKGITLNIIDTAGIRNNEVDLVEQIGIEKAKKEAENSDLIILIFDSSKSFDDEDIKLLDFCKNIKKKTIILLNKNDIKNSSFDFPQKEKYKIIPFSTKTKEGFENLLSEIESLFINNEINFNDEIFLSNERQLFATKNALNSLTNALNSLINNMPEDLLTIDLNDAYTNLSQVLGLEVSDDVINEIFSKFCMGK